MTNLDVNASLIRLLLTRQLNIWREQLAKKFKVRCSLGHNKVVRVFQTMPEKVASLLKIHLGRNVAVIIVSSPLNISAITMAVILKTSILYWLNSQRTIFVVPAANNIPQYSAAPQLGSLT